LIVFQTEAAIPMPDPNPPIEPDASAGDFQVGDRVRIEGEVCRTGKTGHWVKFESGCGLFQYVWVKFKHLFKTP
jgi:hypothetical protein